MDFVVHGLHERVTIIYLNAMSATESFAKISDRMQVYQSISISLRFLIRSWKFSFGLGLFQCARFVDINAHFFSLNLSDGSSKPFPRP